jgi:hypothetical protein
VYAIRVRNVWPYNIKGWHTILTYRINVWRTNILYASIHNLRLDHTIFKAGPYSIKGWHTIWTYRINVWHTNILYASIHNLRLDHTIKMDGIQFERTKLMYGIQY